MHCRDRGQQPARGTGHKYQWQTALLLLRRLPVSKYPCFVPKFSTALKVLCGLDARCGERDTRISRRAEEPPPETLSVLGSAEGRTDPMRACGFDLCRSVTPQNMDVVVWC